MSALLSLSGGRAANLGETGGLPGQVDGNIYMDYNGSTPVDPKVRDAMIDAMSYVQLRVPRPTPRVIKGCAEIAGAMPAALTRTGNGRSRCSPQLVHKLQASLVHNQSRSYSLPVALRRVIGSYGAACEE